jgi:hypothetical protein
MRKYSRPKASETANQQSALALLAATFAFLHRNDVSKQQIVESALEYRDGQKLRGKVHQYRRLVRAYEDMGIVMSTWYTSPKFLDREGRPLPLSAVRGTHSVSSLVRFSRVKTSIPLAVELMRRSSSVRIDVSGDFIPLKRVFFLPDFEVPRAALVIERYLETLRRNSSAHKNGATLLLERNCHVPEIDLKRITPILRDIKGRGTAFMASVDGDIEAHRIRRSGKKGVGELGVLVFAWTRPSKAQRTKPKARANLEQKPPKRLRPNRAGD